MSTCTLEAASKDARAPTLSAIGVILVVTVSPTLLAETLTGTTT